MQGAELNVDNQYAGLCVRKDRSLCDPQGGDGGGAAHEANHRPLQVASQPKAPGENLVETGRHEARAGCQHEMGYPARLSVQR